MKIAIVPDPAQQLAQFAAANIDELVLDNFDDLTAANQRVPKAATITVPGTSYPVYVQLGDPASVFQDIRVRQALSAALDRDALNKAIYKGKGIQNLFVPPYMGRWSLKVEDLDSTTGRYYKYDPGEVKKLLEAAGASNLQLKFAYPTGGGFTPLTTKLAEAISNMLNGAGIRTNLVAIDYNKDLVDAGKGYYQGYFDKDTILFGGTAGYDEADQWLFSYFNSKSTPEGAFAGHLKDSTLDAMIDKERTIVDEGERFKAVKEIEQYIAGKMYVVPSIGGLRYAVLQPRLQNYSYTMGAGKWTETYAKLWLKE
jgi:ABC-type transport system substrate-binding protein